MHVAADADGDHADPPVTLARTIAPTAEPFRGYLDQQIDAVSDAGLAEVGFSESGRPPARHIAVESPSMPTCPSAPDTSAKPTPSPEARRSLDESKFVFSSAESGTVELDVEAVREFEPVEGGLTRITLDAAHLRGLSAPGSGTSSGSGLVPFVMATPHHASAAAIREQIKKAEASAAILDVETAFIKDVWGDETIPAETLRF